MTLGAGSGVDVHGHHLSDGLAYAIIGVLAFFAVLSLIRKLIVLAVVAALIAAGVFGYHQGAFN